MTISWHEDLQKPLSVDITPTLEYRWIRFASFGAIQAAVGMLLKNLQWNMKNLFEHQQETFFNDENG